MKRLVYVWMVCAAAGFAVAVVAAIALSITIDRGALSQPQPAAMELRPMPRTSVTPNARDLGHDRLLAG